MRTPSVETIETAITWLRCNEGDQGEAEECHAVADWLQTISDRKLKQEAERIAAKELGIPVKFARKLLRHQDAIAKAGAARDPR